MNEKQYLSERLDDQIKWYSSKSSDCKKRFYIIRMLEIFISASIPILFYISSLKNYIPILSAVIVILVGLLTLLKLQENWLLYRTTSESLKHEKYLYLTNTEPYNRDNKLSILVKNVEQIISSENSLWKQKTLTNNQGG